MVELREVFAQAHCASNLRKEHARAFVLLYCNASCANNLRKWLARAACLREVKVREAKLREEVARGFCTKLMFIIIIVMIIGLVVFISVVL